jgi:hypothetical protein
VNQNYPEENQVFVLANAALAMAKVFSPAVRLTNRIFEDRVVINVGEMRIGKSIMAKSIINLLGLDPNIVMVSGDQPFKTPERIRNYLMNSNAPLFIDDLGVKGFEAMTNIILPSTVDGVKIGAQAERYGFGFAYEFKSLRSFIVNTNIGFGKIKQILSEHGNIAWSRRVILLQWNGLAKLRPGVVPYNWGSVLGCLKTFWDDLNFRKNAIEMMVDLFSLAEMVIMEFTNRYRVKVKTEDLKPYLDAIDSVKKKQGKWKLRSLRLKVMNIWWFPGFMI